MSELKMKTNEESILLRQAFRDSTQAIRTLANLAKGAGAGGGSLIERIQQRELEYPTGWRCRSWRSHCGRLQPALRLHRHAGKPVAFKSMDRSGDDVMVNYFPLRHPRPEEPAGGPAQIRRCLCRQRGGGSPAAAAAADLLRELNQILEAALHRVT